MKPKAATGPRAARAGAVGFTVLALALTALTAYLLSRVFGEGKYATEPLADVVVAARELPAAEIIKEDDIKVVQWPQSTIPEGAFRSRDQVLGPKPRVPVVSLLPGEAIVSRRLSSPEAGTGMASRVPMDKRGFPIRVDNWIADAKLVYPGAVVDVIATVTDPVERTPITMTVLQRLTVLAVNGHVDAAAAPDPTNPQDGRRPDGAVVTVLVSPRRGRNPGALRARGQAGPHAAQRQRRRERGDAGHQPVPADGPRLPRLDDDRGRRAAPARRRAGAPLAHAARRDAPRP
jgi:Flp pilus assembly protein CpaB